MRVPYAAHQPSRWSAVRVVFILGLILTGGLRIAGTASTSAAEGDVGYRSLYHGTKPLPSPTREKPESKLWWNDGFWWGNLFNATTEDYHIYRLDLESQRWVDTGTQVDGRHSSLADVLWDETAQKLYITSHLFTTDGQTLDNDALWARLYRYSYHSATKEYTLDSDFPVNVTRGKSETLTVAKDSTGQLWVTYVENGLVMVNRSLGGNDATWGEPFVLPVTKAETVDVTHDDISAVIAFQDDKIGVMWSNQLTAKMHFAVHLDGAEDNVWQAEETALPGPKCDGPCADDHINIKSLQTDDSGRVFAATKTSQTRDNAPLIMLLVRDLQGSWDSHTFGRAIDHHTRPIVLLDDEHDRLYMFATSPEAGGAVYYKSTDLNNIAFEQGQGATFIKTSTDLVINDATSTKQNLDSKTGLVVLASDKDTNYYLHNYLQLGTPPTPTNTPVPSNTPTPTSTSTEGPTPTATDTPVPPTPTNTPMPGTNLPIKDITFEDGSLTHLTSGVDKVLGTVNLETSRPLKGLYAATFPNSTNSYLLEDFTASDDLYMSLYLRIAAMPGSDVRIVQILNAGANVGNIWLAKSGALQLRDGSTVRGESAPLSVGVLYRVGIHQKKGSGGDAVLEGYAIEGDAAFGAPFAVWTSGTWTTAADRLRVGPTSSGSFDATVDDMKLDAGAMPLPSDSSPPPPTSTPTNTPTEGPTPTATDTPVPPTPTNTPVPGVSAPIKDITFEDGSLTHLSSGADTFVGAIDLEERTPVKGTYSARVPNASNAYLQEDFTTADDFFVSFYMRVSVMPSDRLRIASAMNGGTNLGNLRLSKDGRLMLYNESTFVGSASSALSVGTLYRIGLHQKKGSSGDAILQAYLAEGDASFAAPFAELTNGIWTIGANRLRVGATAGFTIDATFDDIRLDAGAMPSASQP